MNNKVIYEIYPLTFNYAKGSESDPYQGAYGNLKGITAMAEYIKSLGVDAIWIAPFFKWNKNGFGYDITDYYAVDPMYGTLADFEELCQKYHQLGIEVYIDQVYNHCSEKHPWFEKSIKKIAPYTDYFVWQDAKGFDDEGKPIAPTNWPSQWDASGENVWMWNEERKQFYMHSFDYTMPNLNINNPVVRQELLNVADHWFKLGVDGFRLDATCHYGYDDRLLNNLLDENGEQKRIYDINNKIGRQFLNELKNLSLSYDTPKTLLAEFVFDKGKYGNAKGVETVRTSICDSFYLGSLSGTLKNFEDEVSKALKVSPKGEKLNWAFSNHDMERAATRLWGDKYSAGKSALLMDLMLTLPGSICLFQGDELGMPNPKDLQKCKNLENDPRDVWSIANNPWDGARSGFCKNAESHMQMALHPDERQLALCIDAQEKNPNSVLNQTRRAIKARKEGIFSELGNFKFVPIRQKDIIAFVRTNENGSSKLLCLYNFQDKTVEVSYLGEKYILAPESRIYKSI